MVRMIFRIFGGPSERVHINRFWTETETSRGKKMLLTLENLMGFVVNSEKHMRMLKDGEKTCMLSTSCAQTDRFVKYVSLHGGFGMRQQRSRHHQTVENLVGTLRNRKGRCMMGPFEDAESLWRASQGGVAFKLGMTFRELKTMMQIEPRNPLYVYRFHSVEIDVRVKWYDFYQPCGGRPRNRTEMPEYDTKEACGSPHIQFGLHLEGPPAVPRGMSRTLWMGRVATRTPRGNFNLEQMLVEKRKPVESGGEKARKKYKERKPVETWSMHGSAQPYSQVVVENGTAAGAVLSNPLTMEPYYQLGPPDFLAVCGGGTSMSEFNAVYQGGSETVLLEPVGPVVEAFAEIVDPSQDVYGMLFDTLEVCKRLRLEGCEAGMGAWRLESLGLIEDSIEDIQAALDNGETDAVVDALNDLRRAIGEYGWGMQMNEKDGKGISHDKIERVRRLWRAVKTLEGGLATIVEV